MLVGLVGRALAAEALRLRGASPVWAAVCAGLAGAGGEPSPAVIAVFDRYFRIVSATNPELERMLAGLHFVALQGDAPALAGYLPSCGGRFRPGDEPALVEAAEAALIGDGVLDFMLQREPVWDDPVSSAALLLGALATVDRFPGGVSVVQMGCGTGADLLFDQYAYRIGPVVFGEAEVPVAVDLVNSDAETLRRLAAGGIPPVVGRVGLDSLPRDLTDTADRMAALAFLPPEETEPVRRVIAAAELQERTGRPDIRQGSLETDLAPLLAEAYRSMPPGNTLLFFHTRQWGSLYADQQRQVALSVQMLASRLEPHKPLAWLQTEPPRPGADTLMLHLQTFGWADPEDRAVRRLADADGALRWVRLRE